jgi:hypothetical protein
MRAPRRQTSPIASGQAGEREEVLNWRPVDDWAKSQPAVFVLGGLARWLDGQWFTLMDDHGLRSIQWDVTEYAPIPGFNEAHERAFATRGGGT